MILGMSQLPSYILTCLTLIGGEPVLKKETSQLLELLGELASVSGIVVELFLSHEFKPTIDMLFKNSSL